MVVVVVVCHLCGLRALQGSIDPLETSVLRRDGGLRVLSAIMLSLSIRGACFSTLFPAEGCLLLAGCMMVSSLVESRDVADVS